LNHRNAGDNRTTIRFLIGKILPPDFPFMVRQAHHERKIKWLLGLCPFALSLSKGERAKTEESY
jgi:hypothetical protein